MKSLLKHPWCYLLFQTLTGATRSRKWCIDHYARPLAGERVLDVGCGPGFVVDFLPEVDYVGFDIDQAYIQHAESRYGDRAEFHCLEFTEEHADDFGQFDLIMLNGVLHHLDDNSAANLLQLLNRCLAPQGRLMTLDGCFQEVMSPVSRYLLRQDRGDFVRYQEQYEALASSVFPKLEMHLHQDLFYIPYSALVMVCTQAVPAEHPRDASKPTAATISRAA